MNYMKHSVKKKRYYTAYLHRNKYDCPFNLRKCLLYEIHHKGLIYSLLAKNMQNQLRFITYEL